MQLSPIAADDGSRHSRAPERGQDHPAPSPIPDAEARRVIETLRRMLERLPE